MLHTQTLQGLRALRGGSAYLYNQTRFISESRPSVYAAMGSGSELKYT
jgi:hypothetical protein